MAGDTAQAIGSTYPVDYCPRPRTHEASNTASRVSGETMGDCSAPIGCTTARASTCGGARRGGSLEGAISPRSVFHRRGQPHGFEWWLNEDQASVHEERHWRAGQKHGIERDWDLKGRLRRRYPKYFVAGQQVTHRQYIKAVAKDASLPPFRKAENRPRRVFPAVIARHLGARL
jgi:hypothetical protein